MKLISIEMTRLTSLFLSSRPNGQIYLPDAIQGLAEKYSFLDFPKDYPSMKSNKIEFVHGRFKDTSIERLEIFNDGVVISSIVNSDVLESFLDEIIQDFKAKWNASIVEAFSRKKMYESTLVFWSDKDIFRPLSMISNIGKSVSDRLKAAGGGEFVYEPVSMALSADLVQIPTLRPSLFRIERRDSVEFGFNLYFSTAPLRTDDHLAVLQEWEDSL